MTGKLFARTLGLTQVFDTAKAWPGMPIGNACYDKVARFEPGWHAYTFGEIRSSRCGRKTLDASSKTDLSRPGRRMGKHLRLKLKS